MEDNLKKYENGRRLIFFWKTRMTISKKWKSTSKKILKMEDDLKKTTEDDLNFLKMKDYLILI